MKTKFFQISFLTAIIIICLRLNLYSQPVDSSQAPKIMKPLELYPETYYDHFNFSDFSGNKVLGSSDSPTLFANVNISNFDSAQNEPSIRISRKNPSRVVAAWRDFRTQMTPALRRIGYSYSTNGGTTWSPSALLPNVGTYTTASDPVVCIDTSGNFYILLLALGMGNNSMVIFKSTNQGVSFDLNYTVVTAIAGDFEDKEYMTCDFTPGSPYKNNLYISWSRFFNNQSNDKIMFTASTNAGVNWSTPVQVSDNFNVQGSVPAVGLNGEVYVTWRGSSGIMFDKSTNGGLNWATDILVSSTGSSWFPSICTDLSGGPRNGFIYITWNDQRNGDDDIFLSYSSNRGSNWSAPVRVNDDALGNGKKQYWPWIAADSFGRISIVYYDTRNTPNNTIVEAYLARSSNGGVTFLNEKLSTQMSPTLIPNQDVRFGDYIGIDAWRNRIVPVWTDERAGGYNMDIYTAVIDINVGITENGNNVPDKYYLGQNFPNPFNPTTKIKYEIPAALSSPSVSIGDPYVTLKVFDLLGRQVETLINEIQSPGIYEVTFDGSGLSNGVYFYKLNAGNFTDTKKMILIK